MIYGNCIGGVGLERTYILVDENGNEYPAVMVDKETVFDATSNDIRIGKTAATSTGVTVGTKEIPSYQTTEGYKLIQPGSEFILSDFQYYNYTKLQVIICAFDTSVENSTSANVVCFDGKVYVANSASVLSTVSIDDDTRSIKLGLVNDGDIPYVMRYFTYKEEY